MKIQYAFILMLCIGTTILNSQSIIPDIFAPSLCQGSGYPENGFTISGQVLEEGTGESVMFVSVALYKDGVLLQGTEADLEGNYSLKNIPIGVYSIEYAFLRYQTKRKKNVIVSQDMLGLNIKLKEEKISSSIFMNCNTVVLSNLGEIKSKKKEQFTVSGKVIDEITGEPVMFARIILYKDEVIYKETETNLEGNYIINNIVSGEYNLEPSFVGYQPKTIKDIVVNQDLLDYDIKIKELESSRKECICKKSAVTYYCQPIAAGAFRLSGQVLDKDTKEPLMFASVALYTKEGTLLSGAETDLEGRYIFNSLPKDEYHIEASFIGYQPKRITGTVNRDALDLDIAIREQEAAYQDMGCFGFRKPLIRQDDTTSGMALMSYEIRSAYSLNYSRSSKTKKKRKNKKERKKGKDNVEEETIMAPKEVVAQEVKIKKEAIDIHMYPNPTSGQVYIEASTEIEKVDVLNMEGKLILSLASIKDNGINLTQLSAATYFLRFHHKEGVQVEKLIVIDSQ